MMERAEEPRWNNKVEIFLLCWASLARRLDGGNSFCECLNQAVLLAGTENK